MSIFDYLLGIYALCSVLCIFLYLPRLSCWLYARKKQPRLKNEKKNRLALIIPARNESTSIGALLDSIQTQTYPRELFDAHVIVADPADATIAMAQAAGAKTHVVADQTCKGDALDACMKTILAEDPYRYDAFIIVDADCILDEGFCEEMNNAMASDAHIICSKKRVKNYFFGTRREQPLSACCNATMWPLLDNLGNAGKSARGITCFTVGTGLLLRADIVRENNGWPYRATITEDVELQHDIVLKGWKTFYYQHAVLYMEEATSLHMTNLRRRRWLTGVIDGKRLYAPRIAADPVASKHRRDIYYTRSLWLGFTVFGIATLFCLGNAIAAIPLFLLRSPLWVGAVRNALIGFGAIYGMFFAMTLAALIADWENTRISFPRKLLLLFLNPFFYMEYIPIIGTALFTRYGRKWDAIERVDFSKAEEK